MKMYRSLQLLFLSGLLGFTAVAEGVFPSLFGNAPRGWYFFMGEVGGRVFLYRYADGAWIDVAEGKRQD